MSASHVTLTADYDDLPQLARDLAQASGLLSEIATCWRRAWPAAPGLPVGLPLRLQETAYQARASIRSLPGADPARRADLALTAARHFTELHRDVASAWAIAQAAGVPDAGDTRLRDSLADTLDRAGKQLLNLILQVTTSTGWSPSNPPAAGIDDSRDISGSAAQQPSTATLARSGGHVRNMHGLADPMAVSCHQGGPAGQSFGHCSSGHSALCGTTTVRDDDTRWV